MSNLGVFGEIRSINDYKRAEEEFMLRKLTAQRLATGSTPAALKVAQEIETRLAMGDIEGANRIADAAKLYDKGFQVYGNQPTNPGIPQQPAQPQGQMAPEQQAQMQELYGEQPGYQPAQPVNLIPMQPQANVGVRPGYNEALASREAAIKGAGKQAEKNVELNMDPPIERAKKQQGKIGEFEGEEYNDLTNRSARMPQLIGVANRLSALGKLATYTYAGQGRDFLARQAGMDVPDAAVARSAYISMVDNEILPLLRETFGAQFTQREGESLKITLGDPDKSPEEKDAVLRSFLQTKMETINTGARKIGQTPPYSDEDIQTAISTIGTSQDAPAQQEKPKLSTSEMRFNLKKKGYTDQQIEQYLKAKGL